MDTATQANSTLSSLDSFATTGTNNSLTITLTGGGAAQDVLNGALIQNANLQTINIRSLATNAMTLEATAGVTAVNSYLGTAAITLGGTTGLANTTSTGIVGNGVVAFGNLSSTYVSTATTPVLNLTGGTAGTGTVTIVAAGATTSTINSTGAANTIGALTFSNTAAATSRVVINATTNLTTGTVTTVADTITINGAATLVTLGAITDANLKTINASGMTAGGVSVALLNTVTSFTGGSGADTVTTVAALGSTAAISGGAGTADILSVVAGDTTSLSTAALGGRFTNFEILRSAAGASLDLANISGITSVQIAADASGFIGMNATQAAAVTVRAGAATATLALTTATGTSDVLNLNFANSTATTGNTLGGTALTVNGFETINATSTNGSSVSHNVLSFAGGGAATSLKAINILGSKPFDLVTATASNTKAMTVSASGLTYASTSDTDFSFTYTGALIQGSSVTGSASSDSFTLSSAAGTAGQFVSYDGGAGNDAFSSTVAIINNNAGATASAKIEGGDGTDTLTITGAATMVDNNFQFLTGLERVTFTDTGALNLVSGGFFNTNFAGGVRITDTAHADGAGADFVINIGTYTGPATIIGTTAATVTANANPSITTGSGADTITMSAAALTTGNMTISSGAGVDTISLTLGAQTTGVTTITGGTGADIINWGTAAANTKTVSTMAMTIAVGDSTTTAWDQVSNFDVGTAAGVFGSTITFAAKAINGYAATAATGYSSSELTVAVAGIGAANKGAVTFAGTSAAGLTLTQKISAVQSVVTVTNGDTCFFVDSGSTYIFNNNSAGDSVVQLVGTTVVLLDTTNATTAGLIFLA